MPGKTTAFREAFEIELFTGTDVYFASEKLGQISIKWNDLENDDQLRLEILNKKAFCLYYEKHN